MCGISGIVGERWDRAQLEAMVRVQHHRGPDANGTWISADGRVGLGHNRLSIIDLSPAGNQPMANADGLLWITFNGEIYNYRELRAELTGYSFRSHSDTEVILAAYVRWGERCVERFIGMFAFAIWDMRERRLFCARDRLGIKPFHYAWHGGRFLFASEIKALLEAGLPAAPNHVTWASYLVHGYYDHTAETFFKGVQCLPAGHTLTLADGRVTQRCYWDLPALAAEPLALDDDAAAAHFLDLFDDAVRLRLRSDVPLGVNLSGGLDSASLMVTADRALEGTGKIQTFTASFDEPRYDEQDFAAQVPGTRPWVRNVECLGANAVWPIVEQAMWHQEAPFGGVATLAYHQLHRLARERGITVLLEGQGVDEMLGGYAYFRAPYHRDLLEQRHCRQLRNELRVDPAGPSHALVALRHERDGTGAPLYQDGTSHLHPETIAPELREVAGRGPVFDRPLNTHLDNALYRDLRYTKLPRVLRMNDRLSMAGSRELRESYLDHRIVEFLFRLPGHQKIRMGCNKFLLRHAMRGRLPDEVRLASKRAVVTPQREWLRTALRPHVEELIHGREFAERGLFDVEAVRRAFTAFCAGDGANAFFIWQWINTELWFRRFQDRAVRAAGTPQRTVGVGATATS